MNDRKILHQSSLKDITGMEYCIYDSYALHKFIKILNEKLSNPLKNVYKLEKNVLPTVVFF